MSNPKTAFVSFLLDETGSMQSIKDDTIGAFNAYVEKLQKAGDDMVFSMVSFNSSKTRKRYVAEPIQGVRPLTEDDYQPDAMTPLIDACVKIIKATAEAIAKRTDDPAVVITIQTDGHENVSVEYTAADLALLVKEKEGAGWQFVFLGAGLDAFDVAVKAGLHIDPVRVVSYDRGRSRQVFEAAADNVAAFARSRDVAQLSFSKEQRDRVGDSYTHRHLDPNAPPDAAARPETKAAAKPPAAPKTKPTTDSKADRKARSSVDDFILS